MNNRLQKNNLSQTYYPIRINKQTVWDFWAKYYERLWVQKYSLGPTRREIIHVLKEKLQADRIYKILDAGCGTGQLLREIKADVSAPELELFGIDYAEEMIRQARKSDNTISYEQMDVKDIGMLNDKINKFNKFNKFDVILCTHSFPYYADQAGVIRRFSDCLTEGGYLLLGQASQNTLYDKMVMSLVKLTTGKANYPSVERMHEITRPDFVCEGIIRIKERSYMPSIYLFVLVKKSLS